MSDFEAPYCAVCNDEPALHCNACGAIHRDALWDNGVVRMRKRGECHCYAMSASECARGGIEEQEADSLQRKIDDATAPLRARIAKFEEFAKQAHVAAEFAIAHLPIDPYAIGVTSGIIDLRVSKSTIAMMGWVAQESDALINGEESK